MKKIAFAMMLVLLVGTHAAASEATIRFGVLPVIDTLPLQVAVEDGLFKKHGLDVELVKFMSALERDTAMQIGRIDGYFGDLIATYMLLNQGVKMHIATISWRTVPGFPMFGIVLSPKNKDKTLAEMKGHKIGLSKSTIMEFLADKLEAQLGIGEEYLERVEVKKVPIRMQMLMTEQIDSALLPEPLLSLVRLKGGGTLATADNLDIPLTVLCLKDKYFEGDGEAYVQFIAAYKEAVNNLTEHPEDYRDLMARTCRIPPPLAPEFPIYPFPQPALPTSEELAEVQSWMVNKGLLQTHIPDETALSPIKP